MVRTARGRFLYTGGHDAGGVYKTAYRATIPKRAKLTTRGNSQVLALHRISDSVEICRRCFRLMCFVTSPWLANLYVPLTISNSG
jgi:hypothetical protein